MVVDLSINPQKEAKNIENFIKVTLSKTRCRRLVVGLSGGIDSATSCFLAARAVGWQNIIVGMFPYGELNKQAVSDAYLIAKFLKIPKHNIHHIDIKSIVDCITQYDESLSDLRRGNIAARVRMIYLYDLAKKLNALVLGTENKTEHLLGYFTRFGDAASDIEPIVGIYKTQIRQLAKFLKVPERIIIKPPTAGLWQGQTDEGELGFTYMQADKILSLYVDQKKNKQDIIKSGFSKNVVNKVIEYMSKNEFKHKLPYKNS